ncbi:MAG: ECF transporter S component [Clostridia bacterium]|nr:ECF transporter S component [Clostridia bacterium]
MKTALKTRDMVITALLIAIGIIIPIYFGFLRVILPPAFTATLLAHVPIFISIFISPWSAIFTAIGTTIGFAASGLDPVVTARAGSHIVFALVGAIMIKRNCSLISVGIVTAILHALFEALTVYLFLAMGWTSAKDGATFFSIAFYTTGIGTILHDIIDYIVACLVGCALVRAKMLQPLPKLF